MRSVYVKLNDFAHHFTDLQSHSYYSCCGAEISLFSIFFGSDALSWRRVRLDLNAPCLAAIISVRGIERLQA